MAPWSGTENREGRWGVESIRKAKGTEFPSHCMGNI